MIVKQIWTANAYRNFNYLIACSETGEALAIDPLDHEKCLKAAKNEGWQITQILNTHEHRDHTGGNDALVRNTEPNQAPKSTICSDQDRRRGNDQVGLRGAAAGEGEQRRKGDCTDQEDDGGDREPRRSIPREQERRDAEHQRLGGDQQRREAAPADEIDAEAEADRAAIAAALTQRHQTRLTSPTSASRQPAGEQPGTRSSRIFACAVSVSAERHAEQGDARGQPGELSARSRPSGAGTARRRAR